MVVLSTFLVSRIFLITQVALGRITQIFTSPSPFMQYVCMHLMQGQSFFSCIAYNSFKMAALFQTFRLIKFWPPIHFGSHRFSIDPKYISMEVTIEMYSIVRHTNLKEKSKSQRSFCKISHLIESYAFLQSTFIVHLGNSPFLVYHINNSWLNKILSITLLPSIKAVREQLTSASIIALILFVRTYVMSLQIVKHKAIGLQSFSLLVVVTLEIKVLIVQLTSLNNFSMLKTPSQPPIHLL